MTVSSSLIKASSSLLITFAVAACGGGGTPEPKAEPPATPEAPSTPPETKAPEPEAKTEAPPEPKKEEPRARKPAKDILLAPGWAFVLSFGNSDLKAKTEEDCKKKSKDDEEKTKACVSKAGAEAANDRIKFVTDDKGNWWFVSLGKPKGQEIIYNKIPVKVVKEEPDKIVLAPQGKDQGKRPIGKLPGEIVVEMPDEYSVVVNLPDRGKLVYNVKVTGESEAKPVSEAAPAADAKKDPKAKPKKEGEGDLKK